MDSDGFFYAEINGKSGLVPSNFLQDAPPPLHPPQGHPRPRRPSSGHARPQRSPGPPGGHAGGHVVERPRSQPHQQPIMPQSRVDGATNQNREHPPMNGGARNTVNAPKPPQQPVQQPQPSLTQTIMHQIQQFTPIQHQNTPQQRPQRMQGPSQPLIRPSPQPHPQARAPAPKKSAAVPLVSGSAPQFYLPPSHSQVRPAEPGKAGAGPRPRKG